MLTPIRPTEPQTKPTLSTTALPGSRPAVLETWEKFIKWLVSLFTSGSATVSDTSGPKGLKDPAVVQAFSELVAVQQALAELTKEESDGTHTDTRGIKLLEKAFDAATIINASGHYRVSVRYPGYWSESANSLVGEHPITDKYMLSLGINRNNSDVCMTIKYNDTTIFEFNRVNGGLCRATYEITTFPDPKTKEQQRIRYYSFCHNFRIISRKTLGE